MNSKSSAFRFTRLPFLAALVFVAPLMVGAADAPPAVKAPVPVFSLDENVRNQLLELDRRLEADPKLEQKLTENVDKLTDEAFRKNNPDIDRLLQQQPQVVAALKVERHFLIHRYVVRRARGPVLHADVRALDEFLYANPAVRDALEKQPAQITEGVFLTAHPKLAEFFDQHPSLSTALLENKTPPSRPKN